MATSPLVDEGYTCFVDLLALLPNPVELLHLSPPSFPYVMHSLPLFYRVEGFFLNKKYVLFYFNTRHAFSFLNNNNNKVTKCVSLDTFDLSINLLNNPSSTKFSYAHPKSRQLFMNQSQETQDTNSGRIMPGLRMLS